MCEDHQGENIILQTAPGTFKEEPWQQVLENYIFAPPTVGLISVKETLVHVKRKPTRTYRKGFCPQLYSWSFLNNTLWVSYKKYPGHQLKLEEIANKTYNPYYYSYEKIFDELASGKVIGGAISQFVGMFVNERHEDTLICYKDKLIGKALKDKAIISPAWKNYQERIEGQLGVPVEIAK